MNMNERNTEFFYIDEKRICIQIKERRNQHIPNTLSAVISDTEGHTLRIHKIDAASVQEAMELARIRYTHSPFPKENLLEKMVEHHWEQQKEKEIEHADALRKIGTVTFSVTFNDEASEEPVKKVKRMERFRPNAGGTFRERYLKAEMAYRLWYTEEKTLKQAGEIMGMSSTRTRDWARRYFRIMGSMHPLSNPYPCGEYRRPEPPVENTPRGWEVIAERHGWVV